MMVINPFMSGFAPITGVSLAPNPRNATRLGAGNISSTMTATPIGGSGSYSYAWSFVSSDGAAPSLTGTTTATVSASLTGTAGQVVHFVLRCIVTDTVSGLTAQADGNFTYTYDV